MTHEEKSQTDIDYAGRHCGWYYSPAYEALKPLRESTSKSRLLLVEGVIHQ